jgi:hypothetical protein
MSGQDGADGRVPDPQGCMAGLPYDFRRPDRVPLPRAGVEAGGQPGKRWPGPRVGDKLPT